MATKIMQRWVTGDCDSTRYSVSCKNVRHDRKEKDWWRRTRRGLKKCVTNDCEFGLGFVFLFSDEFCGLIWVTGIEIGDSKCGSKWILECIIDNWWSLYSIASLKHSSFLTPEVRVINSVNLNFISYLPNGWYIQNSVSCITVLYALEW